MSIISFNTKCFVFVLKDSGPTPWRGLYSAGNNATDPTGYDRTGAQLLFRYGNQFSRDQQLRYDGNTDTHLAKGVAFPTDVVCLNSSWDDACTSQFGFAAAQAKSVSLAVNMGINSSLWMLGSRDYDTSAAVSVSARMIREYVRKLFDSLTRTNNDSNFTRTSCSVSLKCYEVFGDQIRDLVALSSACDISQNSKDRQVRVREHPTRGAFVASLVQKTAFSAPEAVQIVLEAYEQRLVLLSTESVDKSNVSIKQSACPKPHQVIGTVGNVVLVIEVEQELVSSCHSGQNEETVINRSATVQFNFLCEMDPLCYKPSKNETISSLSLKDVNKILSAPSRTVEGSPAEPEIVLLPSEVVTTPVQVSQLAVCAKAMASLSRVVTMLQQNTALTEGSDNATEATESAQVFHVPFRESTLTRVLQPMLEGKFVNYIHCCLDERAELAGFTLTTAAYSLRLATELRAGVRSHVVPNERFTRRSAPTATIISPNSRQQVSETAEIAKDITSHSSFLAMEEILRVTERSKVAILSNPTLQQNVDLVAETNLNNTPLDKDNRNLFWDLLQAMHAEGGVDYLDLEQLQQERACLLASLEGMMERADNTVAGRQLVCKFDDAQQDRQEGLFFPSQGIADVGLEKDATNSFNVVTPPAEDSTSFPTTPPGEILGNISLDPVRGSPPSERRFPFGGSNPSSSSALLKSEADTQMMLSPLASLSPLPAPLGAAVSLWPITPRSLSDLHDISSSTTSIKQSLSARDGTAQRDGNSLRVVSSSVKLKRDGLTTSTEKLQRTVRSQSVKGSRAVATLSPVQSPLRRSHTGRAAVIPKASTAGVVGTPPRAKSLLNSSFSPTSKAVAATKSSRKVTSSPASSSTRRAPVLPLSPVLVAGKVATSALGLKTFVASVAEDILAVEEKPIAADGSVKGALSQSPRPLLLTHRKDLSKTNSAGVDDIEGFPTNLAPVDGAAGEGSLLQDMKSVSLTTDTITSRLPSQLSSPLSPLTQDNIDTRQLSTSVMRSLPVMPGQVEFNIESNPSPTTPSILVTTAPATIITPTRLRLLPSERADPSPAHEDAEGSHLSELEVRFLRAVSHTVLPEVAQCIRLGVNIKVKNSFGRDAMQIAARNGSPQLLSLIHEHGGEISTRGPKGDTLYHLAASNGHISVLAWLTEHVYRGAGLAGDAVDIYGQTAAHVAARRGEAGVLRYLHHTLGVDVLQEDFDGRTPLEIMPKMFLSGNAEGLMEAKEFLTSVIDLK